MSDGPIANYRERRRHRVRIGADEEKWESTDGKLIGFNAVGPGWTPLLETLDDHMVRAVKHALHNADGTVGEKYRDKECGLDANITVVQIKEKFGGLRVYWTSKGLGSQIRSDTQGASIMVESLSFKLCERCGSFKGTETRPRSDTRFSRTLTLCEDCHEDRDNEEGKIPFEIGNGDKV